MILYINSCPRKESRTRRLAGALLQKLGPYEEIFLPECSFAPLDESRLTERTGLIERRAFSDPFFDQARRFAAADTVVIAAPYWDLSFPAMLKTYLENIYVTGIVSCYDGQGRPQGLCRAKTLYYVTTAGGPFDDRFGFRYIETLAKDYFGIPEVRLIMAEMLDITGNDPEAILDTAIKNIVL